MSFLSGLGKVANIVSGIAPLVGGIAGLIPGGSSVAKIANTVGNVANFAGNVAQNPSSLLSATGPSINPASLPQWAQQGLNTIAPVAQGIANMAQTPPGTAPPPSQPIM
jgi:hypothetical protein